MKKEMAEYEKFRHAHLRDKVLVHKKLEKRMQVIELTVTEIIPSSGIYKVFCEMHGELGEITIPLEEVSKCYTLKV